MGALPPTLGMGRGCHINSLVVVLPSILISPVVVSSIVLGTKRPKSKEWGAIGGNVGGQGRRKPPVAFLLGPFSWGGGKEVGAWLTQSWILFSRHQIPNQIPSQTEGLSCSSQSCQQPWPFDKDSGFSQGHLSNSNLSGSTQLGGLGAM